MVTNTSADHWTVDFSQPLSFDGALSWAEPENPTLDSGALQGWNALTWASPNEALVVSDTSVTGTSNINGFTFVVSSGGNFYSYQFTDVADGPAGVPDSGSTVGLLALALTALFGANRLRGFRFA